MAGTPFEAVCSGSKSVFLLTMLLVFLATVQFPPLAQGLPEDRTLQRRDRPGPLSFASQGLCSALGHISRGACYFKE